MTELSEHRRKLTKSHTIRGAIASVTGHTSLELNKAAGAPLEKLEIKGNTEQKQLQGYNLFDWTVGYNSSGRVIIVKKENGSITIRPQANNATYILSTFPIRKGLEEKFTIGSKVAISANCKQTDTNSIGGIRLQWFNGATALQEYGIYAQVYMKSGQTEAFLKTTGTVSKLPNFEKYPNARLCLALYANQEGTGSTETQLTYSDMQVTIGGTVLPFEEYCGGIPSPNPGQVINRVEIEPHLEKLDLQNLEYVVGGAATYMLASSTPFNTNGNLWTLNVSNMFTYGDNNKIIAVAPSQNDLFYGTNTLVVCQGSENIIQTIQGEFYVGIGNTGEGIPSGEEDLYWSGVTECDFNVYYEQEVVKETTTIPAFPQEIQNADNLSVELSGINLFDEEKVLQLLTEKGVTFELVNFDGKRCLKLTKAFSTMAFTFSKLCERFQVSYYAIGSYSKSWGAIRNKDNKDVIYIDAASAKNKWYTFSKTSSVKSYGGFSIYMPNYDETSYVYIDLDSIYFQEENEAPLEPHFSPKTISIPSDVTLADGTVVPLRFGKVDTYVDKLLVDKINNKVLYQEYTQSIKLNSNSNFGGYKWKLNEYALNNKNENIFEIHNFPSQYYIAGKGYCNYFTKEIWYKARDNVFFVTDFLLLFRTNGIETLAEWKARIDELEANGTPLEVLVAKPTPIEYDLTDTDFGQELLKLAAPYGQDAILTLNSDLEVSGVSASYYSLESEDKLTLVIKYTDEEGNTIAEPKEHSMRAGTRYKIIAPEINGYTPVTGEIENNLTTNEEITIIYKENENASL